MDYTDRELEEQKLDEWDAGVYPDEEKAKAKAKEFSFETEGFYKELLLALSEAAAYVMANGRRKKAEIEDETDAMKFHHQEFGRHMARFNQLAAKVFVRPVKDADTFFYDFVADTTLYNHTITKGKNKGAVEERTVSSARIEGYRKIIKKYRKLGTAISAQDIEMEFRKTPAYAELKH